MTDARTTKIGFGKRLLTAAASLVMLATCAVTAMPAHAANVAAQGGITSFEQYLTMESDANVPNVTIGYTVAAGTATGKVQAGINAENVTVGSAAFTPEDTEDATDGLPTDTDAVTQGKKYATKTVEVNFSAVNFGAPGIYRYTITRTDAGLPSGVSAVGTSTRTLDVYVSYKTGSETELEVAGYTLQDGTVVEPTDKSTGFTNSYATQNLTLAKEVTGNQGDRDKYFKFTVSISGATLGTVYTVDVTTDADAQPSVDGETKTNPAELTATNGSVSADYYLKDGQSIVIEGLTSATHYTITEADYSTDGYTTTNTDNTTDGKTTGDKTMGTSAHTVTFTNEKQGTVPTGILLDVAPYIVLVALVGVGLIALFATKKRRSR